VTLPVTVPIGTVTIISVSVQLETVAGTTLNNTTLGRAEPRAFIPTAEPTAPWLGERLLMCGVAAKAGADTMRSSVALIARIVTIQRHFVLHGRFASQILLCGMLERKRRVFCRLLFVHAFDSSSKPGRLSLRRTLRVGVMSPALSVMSC